MVVGMTTVFYRVEIIPVLFGDWSPIRQRGRIVQSGQTWVVITSTRAAMQALSRPALCGLSVSLAAFAEAAIRAPRTIRPRSRQER